MNFDPFWAIHNNSDLLCAYSFYKIYKTDYYFSFNTSFWKLAIPIVAIVIPLALLSDLKNLWMYLQHRGHSMKAVQVWLCVFFKKFLL
jgi:hypothetical protein